MYVSLALDEQMVSETFSFAVPDAPSVVSVWSLASGMCVALTVKDLQC